jgi:hypothetical protein
LVREREDTHRGHIVTEKSVREIWRELLIAECLLYNTPLHLQTGMCFHFTLGDWEMEVKLEFWTQGPNFWASTCQVQPLVPICQIKSHGKGPRKIYDMAPVKQA